jgi:SAM-dependent methyltransferase
MRLPSRPFVASFASLPSVRRATEWLASSAASRHHAPLERPEGQLALNAVCDPCFWRDGEWRTYGRALGLPQDEGWYHRKVWEWTQCVYGLERLRALGRDKAVLGVGSGHEPVLYYLANRSGVTIGTDLYTGDFAASAAREADPDFLHDPAKFAPFIYDRRRLFALPADGCKLPFRDGCFDTVYSLSSIEHFGGHERAGQAMQEMSRVLVPGGIACVATELVLEGGAHPAYFTLEHLYQYVVHSTDMRLVEPLTDVRPPQEFIDDPVRLPEEYLKTPHLVLQEGEWKFTSVCLFMRKPTHLDVLSEWSGRAAQRLKAFWS